MTAPVDPATRKALLIAQANLHRMQATLAWHDVRQAVMPPGAGARSGSARTAATWVVGIAVPLLGIARAGRMMRALTITLTVLRIVRGWRSLRRRR
jgi:hypothetical protein